MDKHNFRRTAASLNQNLNDRENLRHTQKQFENQYQEREDENDETVERQKHYSKHRPDSQHYGGNRHMPQANSKPTPFHSALNPLDYYQDFEEDETNDNHFRRHPSKPNQEYDTTEENKFRGSQNNIDKRSNSNDELDADDKLSAYSDEYEEGNYEHQNNSNLDKPRSITNSFSNLNPRNYVKQNSNSRSINKQSNMTLELSPDVGTHKQELGYSNMNQEDEGSPNQNFKQHNMKSINDLQ